MIGICFNNRRYVHNLHYKKYYISLIRTKKNNYCCNTITNGIPLLSEGGQSVVRDQVKCSLKISLCNYICTFGSKAQKDSSITRFTVFCVKPRAIFVLNRSTLKERANPFFFSSHLFRFRRKRKKDRHQQRHMKAPRVRKRLDTRRESK